MCSNETFQLADGLYVTTERDARIDQLLDRREMQLVQARDFTSSELRVGDIRQRATAPESERTLQRRDRLLRVTSGETPTTLFRQRREALGIELAVRELQDIAAAARPQPLPGAERLAQARDVGLEGLHRSGGRERSVEIFDQPVGRDDLACMEEQVREEGALTRATELDRPTVVLDLQFAQDSVFHSPAATGCNRAAAAPQPPASILPPVDRTGRSNRRRKQCRLGLIR